MSRAGILTWSFAMVIVRLGHRFLVVRERKHGQLWYFPAGRIEPGETVVEAAVRETLEESGVPVQIEGLLRVEHTPSADGNRMRFFLVARPVGDTPPKTTADEHSLEARWVTLAELGTLPLRGHEVLDAFRYVADGGLIAPLSCLTFEGAPWR
jgi:phosphatase NudJ